MDPKKIVAIACLLSVAVAAEARTSYKSVLKKWTRSDRVYVWDNMEARLVWHATYLAPEFRSVRRERLADLLEWNADELGRQVRQDGEEEREGDVFFLSIYAGSSAWPEVGKDDGKWRIVLSQDGREAVEATGLERIPVTQVERELFPYLDKWSKTYLVRFPKTLRPEAPFRLRMTGIPAKSELIWK